MDGDREGEAQEAGAAPGAGEGAARPGAGWVHVALKFDDRGGRVWTWNFFSKVSPGENHTLLNEGLSANAHYTN